MLSTCDLIGFIPTTNADQARRFYVDVLGLKFETDDGFAMVVSTNGNKIRIVRLEQFTPPSYTILGWEVAEIEATVKALTSAGVTFLRYPPLLQDDLGIWTTPTGSHVAWFQDPDGNILSLSHHPA